LGSSEELARRGVLQLPILVGGVVPVVHLPGLAESRLLQLSADLLAEIMAGRVERWDDARIAALNPGLALPRLPIRRIVRVDAAGSTEAFTRYLSMVSPAFKAEVGAGPLPAWPGDPERAQGDEGIVGVLRAQPGAIGYVGYDRVLREHLHAVKLRNKAGRFVAPSELGLREALLASGLEAHLDDRASLLDMPGEGAWPITLASFALVEAEPADVRQAAATLRFLYWCLLNGDELAEATGFVSLPAEVQAEVAARLGKVKARNGEPIAYQSM
jgi:phosphate transport system substrate-binding protein